MAMAISFIMVIRAITVGQIYQFGLLCLLVSVISVTMVSRAITFGQHLASRKIRVSKVISRLTTYSDS